MPTAAVISDLLKLPLPERLRLVEDLWDSIAADPDSVPVTTEQGLELERRLEDQAANPGVGLPWQHVRARLLGSR
jgi:putative addiction module component (TIGR02574 family)